MKEYVVEVCRVGHGSRIITIPAPSRAEAEKKALDVAGDYDFSERDFDYFLPAYQTLAILDDKEVNYVDWMKLVLKQKQVLPLLIGLDDDLDELIEERLK